MWIISKKQDLLFIFGGAIASLLIIIPAALWPAWVPLIFWTWALFFDGPHLWATYSRTYVDRLFWKSNSTLLLGSLAFIAIPVVVAYSSQLSGNQDILNLFFALALLWTHYHVVRQHYGFMSLYDRKVKTERYKHLVLKWLLYTGLWAPYGFFIVALPLNQEALGINSLSLHPLINSGLVWIPASISILSFSGLAVIAWRQPKRRIPILFAMLCVFTYSVIFYWIAPHSPFYSNASNPAQNFMMITVMLSLFHNIQYIALVSHYNKNQYGGTNKALTPTLFGLANKISNTTWKLFGAALLFSLFYVTLEWKMGDFPSITGNNMTSPLTAWALGLWWGFSLHHYYLDQKIWRTHPSKNKNTYFKTDLHNA